MKWYSLYTGVGQYILLSEKELAELIQENEDNGESWRNNELKDLTEFNTYNEAKSNIIGGLQCDINDCTRVLKHLRNQTASGNPRKKKSSSPKNKRVYSTEELERFERIKNNMKKHSRTRPILSLDHDQNDTSQGQTDTTNEE